MPTLARLSIASVLAAIVGCGSSSEGAPVRAEASADEQATSTKAGAAPVAALPEASNGAPVSVEFVEWIGEGVGRGARLRVYNHGEVSTAGLTFVLRYYDSEGELSLVKEGTSLENDNDFGTVVGEDYGCLPKRDLTLAVDGKILAVPPAATRAEVLVSKVYRTDPDSGMILGLWTQDNFTEWPGEPPPSHSDRDQAALGPS